MDKFLEWVNSKFKNPLVPIFFIFGVILVLLGVTEGLDNLPVLNNLAPVPDFRWVSVILGSSCIIVSIVTFYRPPIVNGAGGSLTVHKYSGTWIAQNSFNLWRHKPIREPDTVSFNGKTLLVIPPNGEGGSGVQIGKLEVRYSSYSATYDIVNEVQSASVNKTGTLEMHVKVIRRQLIKEDPNEKNDAEGIYADLRRDLDNLEFDLKLKPVRDKPNQLIGTHSQKERLSDNQKASEEYSYQGLFSPLGF